MKSKRAGSFSMLCARTICLWIIGANVGSYTVLAAGATGARTIAVEPIPETFKNLQANVSLNDLSDRTELHCTRISDSRSYLEFTSDLDTVNHVMADNEVAASICIPVVTMDELLPAIIKIDVEGHERAVLEGAKNSFGSTLDRGSDGKQWQRCSVRFEGRRVAWDNARTWLRTVWI